MLLTWSNGDSSRRALDAEIDELKSRYGTIGDRAPQGAHILQGRYSRQTSGNTSSSMSALTGSLAAPEAEHLGHIAWAAGAIPASASDGGPDAVDRSIRRGEHRVPTAAITAASARDVEKCASMIASHCASSGARAAISALCLWRRPFVTRPWPPRRRSSRALPWQRPPHRRTARTPPVMVGTDGAKVASIPIRHPRPIASRNIASLGFSTGTAVPPPYARSPARTPSR